MTGVLLRREEDTETHREGGLVKTEAEIEYCSSRLRLAGSHQKLEQPRKNVSPEVSEGPWGVWTP